MMQHGISPGEVEPHLDQHKMIDIVKELVRRKLAERPEPTRASQSVDDGSAAEEASRSDSLAHRMFDKQFQKCTSQINVNHKLRIEFKKTILIIILF